MSQIASYSCKDFLGFQEALKRMRDLDDKIIYALNTSLPTESFKGQDRGEKCKELYTNLQISHRQREEAIRNCISVSAESVKDLRAKHDEQPNDPVINKKFKAEQRQLRVLQAELNVEEIVKERSLKAFKERCRGFLEASAL